MSLTYPGDAVYTCSGPAAGYNLNLQSCLEALRLLVLVPFPFMQVIWSNRGVAEGVPLPQRYVSCKYPSLG